jgi:DNA-binding beta-propeller fold protein YncE
VVNPGSGDISVIDPVSAKVVATVPVGGSLELGVADGRGRMFVNVEDKKQLVILDTRARKVVRRVALADCGGPTGIASDPASREVVSACGGGNVAIVSRVDGSRVASLPIGNGADGAAFDPIRHLALVPAGKSGNVTLIRLGARPAVVAQVATAVSARTIAVDAATGRAYLPSASLSPAVGNELPKPEPGSFRLLVVGP